LLARERGAGSGERRVENVERRAVILIGKLRNLQNEEKILDEG